MLALTFFRKTDYDKILEDDCFDFIDLTEFEENKTLAILVKHVDGSSDVINCKHTYNSAQINWFKAGSALNLIRKQMGK